MAEPTCAYFVTGTDTEIGKTLAASSLLRALTRIGGLRTAYMKPVAAGAVYRDGQWRNDDAEALAAEANTLLPATLGTPYLLREPCAPHVAAALESRTIDLSHIVDCYRRITEQADAVVVEGVGGFRVPLDDARDTADLAQDLGLPVVLVVGVRLGCINHALLTADAIAARGLHLAGWIANMVDPDMLNPDATIDALKARLHAPMIGAIPRLHLDVALPASHPQLVSLAEPYFDFSRLSGWPVGQTPFIPSLRSQEI